MNKKLLISVARTCFDFLYEIIYMFITNPQELINQTFILLWMCVQKPFIYVSNFCQQNFPFLYNFIWIVYAPFLFSLTFICRTVFRCWKKYEILHKSVVGALLPNDSLLNEIFMDDIELDPEDVEKNNKILNDVVLNRIVDYMKIVDDDFDDLFQDVLYGGSFFKELKVGKPDEYDLCLMIDLSRSIDPQFIQIEPDRNAVSYVTVKICQADFNENEDLLRNLLNEDNYLHQNKFLEWIHCTLKKALTAFSGGLRPEGYIVKHHKNVYCINFRLKGPALKLTVIRKNDWRKIDVDLVPCLVFKNQYLAGFRPRKAKKWIAVAKPLRDDSIENREILWRVGFPEDEKRILTDSIKPVLKLVKQLRDVQDWDHLKSYFIETLFMHELDDPVIRFCSRICSKKTLFIYILNQLQKSLARGELLYYWNKDFNLLDRTNSLPLDETSKELKTIIDQIEGDCRYEDEYLLDMFYPDDGYAPNMDLDYSDYFCIFTIGSMILHRLYVTSALDPYIYGINAFLENNFAFANNSIVSIDSQ